MALICLHGKPGNAAPSRLNPKFRFNWLAWLLFLTVVCVDSTLAAGDTPFAGESAVMVIRSASEFDYPPYGIVTEKGEISGFSVELLRAALSAMGHEVSFELGTWDDVRQRLVDGKVDVLPLVGRTPERESVFDFTFPYLNMHGAIVTRADETGIHSLSDLAGRQIAVMKGGNVEEFVRRSQLDARIITTATFDQALRELSTGSHDAVIIQRLVALQLMRQAGLNNLRINPMPLEEFVQSLSFAVRDGNKELLEILNEGLSKIIVDGTFQRLHSKWFGPIEAGATGQSRIIIGVDSNYPPFEYLDNNGKPIGYNVDLTRTIARNLGLEVTYRVGPWAEIRQALASGEIDLVQGMFYSPERDQVFDFSPAHAVISQAIVIRQGTTMPDDLAGLAGKSLLVVRGDITHDVAVKLGYGNDVILAESPEEALRRLATGEHDYALLAKAQAFYYIDKNKWAHLQVSGHSVHSPESCYAVLNGNTGLLALFAEGLANIKDSGEYRQIYTKWLGVYEQTKLSNREILQRSIWVLAPIALLLTATLLWSWTLRRTVRKRTYELREEIAERKVREDEIRAKNAELDEKNATLEHFAYSLSHDLKNPLVTMTNFLGFLEKDIDIGNRLIVDQDIAYLNASAKSLEVMLADLARFNQIGRTGVLNESFSLQEVAAEAVQRISCSPDEHDALIQITDMPVEFYGNRTYLVELWRQLIDNAAKHRQPNLPVAIDVGVEITLAEVIFHVADNGIGIAPCHHEKIFGLFDKLSPATEGSGLGLAMVKRIVTMNKGRIWVESEGNGGAGSRFRFTLPGAISESPSCI